MRVIDASQPLPPTVGPKLSNPGNLAYDALMPAALDSLPHFNRLGDDSGVSRFGRVPVNLDQVAGQIAGTPGNADRISSVLNRGVLYTYTHASKLLASGADVFFSAARS